MNNLDINFTYEEAKFLVENGIIENGTPIYVNLNGMGFHSVIRGMIDDFERKTVWFKVIFTHDYIRISQKNILKIDGMDAHKVFQAYHDEDDCITINEKTDVKNDVLGWKHCKLENIDLYNGLKIIFNNDVNEEYNGKKFTIKGVGEFIQFANQRGRPKKVLA